MSALIPFPYSPVLVNVSLVDRGVLSLEGGANNIYCSAVNLPGRSQDNMEVPNAFLIVREPSHQRES